VKTTTATGWHWRGVSRNQCASSRAAPAIVPEPPPPRARVRSCLRVSDPQGYPLSPRSEPRWAVHPMRRASASAADAPLQAPALSSVLGLCTVVCTVSVPKGPSEARQLTARAACTRRTGGLPPCETVRGLPSTTTPAAVTSTRPRPAVPPPATPGHPPGQFTQSAEGPQIIADQIRERRDDSNP